MLTIPCLVIRKGKNGFKVLEEFDHGNRSSYESREVGIATIGEAARRAYELSGRMIKESAYIREYEGYEGDLE